ncbi:MAG TPA: hypothetical protein PKY98_05975 [Sedimentibacter sp.]|nr:hypothetical protein [Sedimentibacter sp.]
MYNDNGMNNTVYSSNRYDMYERRFDPEYDVMYDRRFDPEYDMMYDRRYDRRYDMDFYDPIRYYQFPYCDRYGRCENPIWWLFWPLFFL